MQRGPSQQSLPAPRLMEVRQNLTNATSTNMVVCRRRTSKQKIFRKRSTTSQAARASEALYCVSGKTERNCHFPDRSPANVSDHSLAAFPLRSSLKLLQRLSGPSIFCSDQGPRWSFRNLGVPLGFWTFRKETKNCNVERVLAL